MSLKYNPEELIKFNKTNGTDAYIPYRFFEIASEVANTEDVLPQDLLALAVQESSCNDDAVGDGGAAHGAMQINTDYHPNTEECAVNTKCAMVWTARRIKRFGYNKDSRDARYTGLWSHNGIVPGKNEFYPQTVLSYSDRLSEYFIKS